MALRGWSRFGVAGSLLLLACNGGASVDSAAPPAGDLGSSPRGDGPALRSDSAVARADAPALPKTCPCPLDSYCDLNTNACVLGCRNHEHCNAGKYCDTATSMCKPGCRTKADCTDDGNPCTDLACNNGSCAQVNNSAPCTDDGNACTADVCSGGTCTHPPANNGKLCGKTLDCSDYRCAGGACVETYFKAGATCPDDKDGCTTDVCDGKGTCTHPTVADGTICPNTWGGWDAKCFGGKCYPKKYQCCGYSSFDGLIFSTGKIESWTGTTSCGCDASSTMKWSGWYSGYHLDHSEYCSGACENKPGDYCQSCYDLP